MKTINIFGMLIENCPAGVKKVSQYCPKCNRTMVLGYDIHAEPNRLCCYDCGIVKNFTTITQKEENRGCRI